MGEIIININETNKAQKYKKPNELFQREAFERVTEILKEHEHGFNTENIVNCRFHDTIFIDGNRGVGKTAFMLNIEKYYDDFMKEDKKKNDNKFIFLNPIDPTLLEHTEKFLSVVLARIVEKVTDCLGDKEVNTDKLDKYYASLEKLSKSLTAIKTFDVDLGIEEIASSKSSLKLEQHSHEFFKTVCELLNGSHALVILIDDVDMAFDKGFDVLEVVRKYLASPYIIPIVAGDMKLYKEIVETRFMDRIEFKNDMKHLYYIYGVEDIKKSDEYKEKKSLIDNLVEQYLHKIFPSEYHIQLKNIFDILKEEYVAIVFNKDLKVSYDDIKNFEIRHLNLGINQVEFTFQIFSDNTRDLIQYLYSKKDIYLNFFRDFKDYIYEKKKDLPYSLQNFDIDFNEAILAFIKNNHDKLYEKSIYKSSEFYKFSIDRKKKELSVLTRNDHVSFELNKYNLYKAFTNEEFRFLNKFKNLEKSVPKYSIQAKGLQTILNKNDDYKNISNYIIDLFIFNDYYSSHQRRNYIYAGKFLEAIIYSLSFHEEIKEINEDMIIEINKTIDEFLDNYKDDKKDLFQDYDKFNKLNDEIYSIAYDDNDKHADNKKLSMAFNDIKKNYNFKDREDELVKIASKIPFGSEFLHNNRCKDEEFEDDNSIDSNESTNDYNLRELSIEIAIWKKLFLNSVELNSLSLYEIIYKFFTNIEKIKSLDDFQVVREVINGRRISRKKEKQRELKELKENHPILYLRRIVLILINAIAYFENSNEKVANVNIAINEEFNIENILSKTSASLQNIKPMFYKKGSLTRALFFHPIISHILFSEDDSKLYDLSFVGHSSTSGTDENKVNTLEESKTLKIQLNNRISRNAYELFFKDSSYREDVSVDCYVEYFTKILEIYNNLNAKDKLLAIEILNNNKYLDVYKLLMKDLENLENKDILLIDKVKKLYTN